MSDEDIKKRFINEIKLRAYDDKYIDKNEEREILQIAISLGVNIESARAALIQVCEENSFIMQSLIIKQIKDHIESAASKDGTIVRNEFELVFGAIKKSMQGKKNDREIKKMIIQVMEDTGNNKVKKSWLSLIFSDWYTSLKKDLGMN